MRLRKRVFALSLTVIMIFTLCACTDSGSSTSNENSKTETSSEDVTEVIREAAKSRALVDVALDFSITPPTTATVTNLKKVKDGEYEVYGKVETHNDYGNAVSIYFTGTATYNPDLDTITSTNIRCDFDYTW